MTTEIATVEKPSGGGSSATIVEAAEAVWVAVQGSPWPTLAVVPAEPGLSVGKLVGALAATGAAQRGQSVEALDLQGRPLANSQKVVEALAAPQPVQRSIVAVDCPLESQAGLLFARSAGAAILVVAMEHTRMEAAERILDLVGRERFLGAVVHAPRG